MDNVKKEITKLDAMCISSEEKEMRLEELKQLNKSIAYASTMIQFFWKEDTMVSYVREQHYTIVDMLGRLNRYLNLKQINFTNSSCSKFWRSHGMCHRNVSGCCM